MSCGGLWVSRAYHSARPTECRTNNTSTNRGKETVRNLISHIIKSRLSADTLLVTAHGEIPTHSSHEGASCRVVQNGVRGATINGRGKPL